MALPCLAFKMCETTNPTTLLRHPYCRTAGLIFKVIGYPDNPKLPLLFASGAGTSVAGTNQVQGRPGAGWLGMAARREVQLWSQPPVPTCCAAQSHALVPVSPYVSGSRGSLSSLATSSTQCTASRLRLSMAPERAQK